MKKNILFPLFGLLLILVFSAGCASPQTTYGKREVNLLGGIVKAEQGSYNRAGPLTFTLKTSDVTPRTQLKGDKVTLLWGLITFVDE